MTSYQQKDSKSQSTADTRTAERLQSVGQRLKRFRDVILSLVTSVGGSSGSGSGSGGGNIPWDTNAFAGILQILNAGARKINYQRLLVTVVALIKSGKSTFTNAAVGGNLLHNSNEPATSCIAHVRHNPTGHYTLYEGKSPAVDSNSNAGSAASGGSGGAGSGGGGGGGDLSRSIEEGAVLATGKDKIFPCVKQLNAAIRNGTGNGNGGGAGGGGTGRHVVLRAPLTCLSGLNDVLTSRFEWIDTPGRNEAANNSGGASSMAQVVDSIMATTDVIVFMFNYTALGSNDEKLMWEQMYESRPDLLRVNSDRVFYVINRFDLRSSTTLSAEQTIDYICKQVKTYVGYTPDRKRMFFTNSLHAVWARQMMAGDVAAGSELEADLLRAFFPSQKNKTLNDLKAIDWANVLAESGVPEVESQVFRYLTQHSLSFLVDAVDTDLMRGVSSLQQMATVTTRQLDSNFASLEQDVTVLTALQSFITDYIKTNIGEWLSGVEHELTQILTQHFASVQTSYTQRHSVMLAMAGTTRFPADQPKAALDKAEAHAREYLSLASLDTVQSQSLVYSALQALVSKTQTAFEQKANELSKLIYGRLSETKVAGVSAQTEAFRLPALPSEKLLSALTNVISTAVNPDWAAVRSQLQAGIQSMKETKQVFTTETKEISFDVPQPKRQWYDYAVDLLAFGASAYFKVPIPAPKLTSGTSMRTVKQSVPITKVTDHDIQLLQVNAADSYSNALTILTNAHNQSKAMVLASIPQSFASIKEHVLQHLKAPIDQIVESAKRVIVLHKSQQSDIQTYRTVLSKVIALCEAEVANK